MSNGHKHNLSVAWVRLWGAVGARVYADAMDRAPSMYSALEFLTINNLADFEMHRYEVACYALGTTSNTGE